MLGRAELRILAFSFFLLAWFFISLKFWNAFPWYIWKVRAGKMISFQNFTNYSFEGAQNYKWYIISGLLCPLCSQVSPFHLVKSITPPGLPNLDSPTLGIQIMVTCQRSVLWTREELYGLEIHRWVCILSIWFYFNVYRFRLYFRHFKRTKIAESMEINFFILMPHTYELQNITQSYMLSNSHLLQTPCSRGLWGPGAVCCLGCSTDGECESWDYCL